MMAVLTDTLLFLHLGPSAIASKFEIRCEDMVAIEMAKIYTRKGDEGMTDMYSGERVSKDNIVFGVLGANDELSSCIGVAICHVGDKNLATQLRQIQTWLQNVNSDIATWKPHNPFFIGASAVQLLETWIDEMDRKLAALTVFILPGGVSLAGAHLHVCRTKCRNAERRYTMQEMRQHDISSFLNRLSDYFFTAARYADLKYETSAHRRSLINVILIISLLAIVAWCY